MGVDDIKDELGKKKAEAERRIAVEAGKAAVKTAWKGLVAAVSGLADDVLSAGENELAEARAARGLDSTDAPPDDDEPASEAALDRLREEQARPSAPSARDRRLVRERRALRELEALKRAHAAEDPGESPAEDPLDAPPRQRTLSVAQRQRQQREDSARKELDELKERQLHPEDRPPVKRTL